MTNTKQFADDEYLERVRRARAMTPEEKFLAGEILFREREQTAIAEILARNPGMNRQVALEIFKQQLDLEDAAEMSVRAHPNGALNP